MSAVPTQWHQCRSADGCVATSTQTVDTAQPALTGSAADASRGCRLLRHSRIARPDRHREQPGISTGKHPVRVPGPVIGACRHGHVRSSTHAHPWDSTDRGRGSRRFADDQTRTGVLLAGRRTLCAWSARAAAPGCPAISIAPHRVSTSTLAFSDETAAARSTA